MKKVTNLFCIALTMLMVAPFASCSKSDDPKQDTTETSGTVTVIAKGADDADIYDAEYTISNDYENKVTQGKIDLKNGTKIPVSITKWPAKCYIKVTATLKPDFAGSKAEYSTGLTFNYALGSKKNGKSVGYTEESDGKSKKSSVDEIKANNPVVYNRTINIGADGSITTSQK